MNVGLHRAQSKAVVSNTVVLILVASGRPDTLHASHPGGCNIGCPEMVSTPWPTPLVGARVAEEPFDVGVSSPPSCPIRTATPMFRGHLLEAFLAAFGRLPRCQGIVDPAPFGRCSYALHMICFRRKGFILHHAQRLHNLAAPQARPEVGIPSWVLIVVCPKSGQNSAPNPCPKSAD